MRRLYSSDGPLIESYNRVLPYPMNLANLPQYSYLPPRQMPAEMQPYEMLQRDKKARAFRHLVNEVANQGEALVRNAPQEKQQSIILKGMLISLILLVILLAIDSQTCKARSQTSQSNCGERYLQLNCSSIKNSVQKSWMVKECSQLQLCLKNPAQYQLNKQQREWMIKISEVKYYLEWIKQEILWIAGCVFLFFVLMWLKTNLIV